MADDDLQSTGSHSVTLLIDQLKKEDAVAAQKIWQRYFERLLSLARVKLQALSHQAVDEEDILVSVFDRFFRAAKESRFARLHDRDDLWQILLMLTDHKVADEYRKTAAQKRGAGKVVTATDIPQADFAQIQELADREPGPLFVAAFNEALTRAINRLGE